MSTQEPTASKDPAPAWWEVSVGGFLGSTMYLVRSPEASIGQVLRRYVTHHCVYPSPPGDPEMNVWWEARVVTDDEVRRYFDGLGAPAAVRSHRALKKYSLTLVCMSDVLGNQVPQPTSEGEIAWLARAPECWYESDEHEWAPLRSADMFRSLSFMLVSQDPVDKPVEAHVVEMGQGHAEGTQGNPWRRCARCGLAKQQTGPGRVAKVHLADRWDEEEE